MEEGDEVLQEISEEEEEDGKPSQVQREEGRRPCDPKCNLRIDQLSTPNKRIFLALWNEHAHHFPPDKVKYLRQLLQRFYALSPEETAKYFAELRAKAKAAAFRRRIKQKLRKYLQEKRNERLRCRANRLFRRLLRCGIKYASENMVPPLVSIRLRYLSDIILEQLCDMRKLTVPNRSNTDKLGEFLISVADWMAIAVERLYFAAQLSINEMTEYNEPDHVSDSFVVNAPETTKQGSFQKAQPVATSTPKKPQQASFVMGQPMAASTPKGSFQMGQPVATSTERELPDQEEPPNIPYYSIIGAQPVATSTPKQIPALFCTLKNLKHLDTTPAHIEVPPIRFRRLNNTPPNPVVKNNTFSRDSSRLLSNTPVTKRMDSVDPKKG